MQGKTGGGIVAISVLYAPSRPTVARKTTFSRGIKKYRRRNVPFPTAERTAHTVLVGERGFEPPTSSSRTKRATKLRYSPKAKISIAYAGCNGKSSRRRFASQILGERNRLSESGLSGWKDTQDDKRGVSQIWGHAAAYCVTACRIQCSCPEVARNSSPSCDVPGDNEGAFEFQNVHAMISPLYNLVVR